MINVCLMSVNVPGENSGTKGQTGTKGQGQRQGYSLPPYVSYGLVSKAKKTVIQYNTEWNLAQHSTHTAHIHISIFSRHFSNT